MKFNIQLSEEDYVKANFLHLRPRPSFKLLGYFLVFLLLIFYGFYGYMIFNGKEDATPFWLSIGFMVYIVYLLVFDRPRRFKKKFRQRKTFHLPYTIEFKDDLVIANSANGESRLTWDYFIRWKENDLLINLYEEGDALYIIPKRYFSSPEELAQFRELLVRKIGSSQL